MKLRKILLFTMICQIYCSTVAFREFIDDGDFVTLKKIAIGKVPGLKDIVTVEIPVALSTLFQFKLSSEILISIGFVSD